jgi:hypothetical protein
MWYISLLTACAVLVKVGAPEILYGLPKAMLNLLRSVVVDQNPPLIHFVLGRFFRLSLCVYISYLTKYPKSFLFPSRLFKIKTL